MDIHNTPIGALSYFLDNLMMFFDELIGMFPEEGDLIYMRIFLKDRVPVKDVVERFLKDLDKDPVPDEKGNMVGKIRLMIRQHNDDFFLKANVFDELSSTKVSHFKHLWQSAELDEEERLAMWAWIARLVKLADKYAKAKEHSPL